LPKKLNGCTNRAGRDSISFKEPDKNQPLGDVVMERKKKTKGGCHGRIV